MATEARTATRLVRPGWVVARIPRPRWAVEAWLVVSLAAVFVGITSWWLTRDRSIPIFDAGLHLQLAMHIYEYLSHGHVGRALTLSVPYPPFAYLVGALGLWIGGLGVAAPILAQNLVFVPLLALGCYHVGRLAFGPRAGLLAVVFALGSPLIAAQFHVFMVDAPETAMVAVSVWLVLASKRFSRTGISALAGAAVGLGMLTKEPFAFFLAGTVLVVVARGGWRHWRGLAAFSLVALALALPWYVSEFSKVHALAQGATNASQSSALEHGIFPARLSVVNLLWYSWNIVNFQLLAPLFAFAMLGGAWTIAGLVRRRAISPLAWELTVGALVGWLGITLTYPHDTRYSMPLLVYLAVLGGGWIARLSRTPRLAAACVLGLVAIANTLATSFGVGRPLRIALPTAKADLEQSGNVTVYSNAGFLVAGPQRDGDVLTLMHAMRHDGVLRLTWLNLSSRELSPLFTPDFSSAGLAVFADIAGLEVLKPPFAVSRLTRRDAVMAHGPIEAGNPPPCVRLGDRTGVWIRLGNPNARGVKDYCPLRHPAFY